VKRIKIIDGKIWCPKCLQHKIVDDFYSFNGAYKRPCKECKVNYQKIYSQENEEHITTYRDNYYQENRDEIIVNQLKRNNKRKDKIVVYQAEYRQENKGELQSKKREYKKIKRQNDPAFKLRGLVSNAIFQALKYAGSSKDGSSIFQYLPYSMQELKEHLEKQFEPWMTWNNWGVYDPKTWDDNNQATWTWHIDHIVAQTKLPYVSMTDENFQKCWALENLRPLSSKQNIIKGNK
jgi:hypothetical protein